MLSIALTPALATLGRYAASYIRDRRGRRASSLADESEHLAEHVLVAGYGRVGQAICRLLDNAEIGYVVLDLNVQRVIRARARGLPVYFGDASRIDVLRAAGVERASLAVIAIDSPAMAERMAAALHEIVPNLVIVARAWDAGHAQRLAHLGVNEAIPEDIEIGLGLGSAMLRRLGRFAPDVDRYIAAFRAEQQTYGSAEPDKTTERITKD